MATNGQFSWPSVGSSVAAYGQFGMAANTQIPCILLARLAVDEEFKGAGLGWGLLRDALIRSFHISGSIGAAAVLIHCRDESAKSFYLHHGDFLQSPIEDLHLMIPMKELRRFAE